MRRRPRPVLRVSASSASRPLRAISTCAPLRLEHAGQREDVAHVVLDHQDAAAVERRVAVARRLQHALPLGRQRRLDLVQEQRHLVEQALGRARALDDDRLRVAAQPLLFVARQRAAGVDDDRRERRRRPAPPSARAARSRSGPAGSGRAPCSRRSVVRSCASASAAVATPTISHVAVREQLRGCSRAAARRPRRPARAAAPCENLASSCRSASTSCSRLTGLSA